MNYNVRVSNAESVRKSRAGKWVRAGVCLGVLVVVVDGTAVLLALPVIKTEFTLSDADVGWVMNAFWITFAGFRLLSGRLADAWGCRVLFLRGLLFFTLASLGCVFAVSGGQLIAARAVQGLAGSTVVTAALSLLTTTFQEAEERAKAIALYGFATAGGGTVGLLFGGVLTGALGWRCIFLADFLLGTLICGLCFGCLPAEPRRSSAHTLDFPGAIVITLSLVAAIYTIGLGSELGWSWSRVMVNLACAGALLTLFVKAQAKASEPLIPRGFFAIQSLLTSCVTNVLFSAAASAGVFVSLYLQLVLGYDAFKAGLTFLPLNAIIALFSLGASARLVIRFGIRPPLTIGLLIAAGGLAWLGRTPVHGNAVTDVLPGLALLGLGTGVVLSPLMLGAMAGVPLSQTGLASGVIGTSSSMGRAVGLAILVGASASRTKDLLMLGAPLPAALNDGYHTAFFMASGAAAGAAVFVFSLPRRV